MKNKKGFTLLEILIVVAIIAILSSIIFVFMSQSKKNARLNNAKTLLRTTLPAVVACNDSNGTVNVPSGSGTGNTKICQSGGMATAYWPKLNNGYLYVAGGNYSYSCNFQISTNGDSANLTCNCINQICK